MSPALIHAVVFIEGFCSLGAEVIALRRLVPHLGSAIVVTAPTIGFFLLALALGYASGGKVKTDFRRVVARNFLAAAALSGVGLSAPAVNGAFAYLQPAWVAYLLVVGGVLGPLAWLMGQTVPILTNELGGRRVGEASGNALFWSTLGSFLSALLLSLTVMQWLGVSAAVWLCAGLLGAGVLMLTSRRRDWVVSAVVVAVAAVINFGRDADSVETAYADYAVKKVELAGFVAPRVFSVNGSTASILDDSDPPRTARYVAHLRHILLDDLAFTGREILVLGAGGFTLSLGETRNHYTYVDIDPAIRALAEERFLGREMEGEFVVDDARRFVAQTTRRFDAVVVDVFSDHHSVPSHLVTREFWQAARQALKPDGVLLANLILDGRLETPYARGVLATLEGVFGRCGVEVLHRGRPLANVVTSCYASSRPAEAPVYTDERNGADVDRIR
ncbi:MAG: fused MFS/spermidine synthase [Zoogloeaceae bacterium]|nr:fused MFS/spermidine synthase [Zoogloeaceae bacterium]